MTNTRKWMFRLAGGMMMALAVAAMASCHKKQSPQAEKGGNPLMGISAQELTEARYLYRIEGAYMAYRYVEIDFTGNGEGTIRFNAYSQGDAPEQTAKIVVPPADLAKLNTLLTQLDFFNFTFNDLNKDRITVTDVGTTTIGLRVKGHQRQISYGYVEDPTLNELAATFWSIASRNLPPPEKK